MLYLAAFLIVACVAMHVAVVLINALSGIIATVFKFAGYAIVAAAGLFLLLVVLGAVLRLV